MCPVCLSTYPLRQEEGCWSLEIGLRDSCECHVGVGSGPGIIYESSKCSYYWPIYLNPLQLLLWGAVGFFFVCLLAFLLFLFLFFFVLFLLQLHSHLQWGVLKRGTELRVDGTPWEECRWSLIVNPAVHTGYEIIVSPQCEISNSNHPLNLKFQWPHSTTLNTELLTFILKFEAEGSHSYNHQREDLCADYILNRTN